MNTIIGAALLMLLVVVFIGISVGLSIIRSAFKYTPPTLPPAPAPEITITPVSSKFATDAGVLKLRDDLKKISQSIDTVDLIEPQISPPALDLEIKIE
jgi:hypothetical protein